MTFKAKFTRVSKFKNIIESIKDLLTDINIYVTNDGFRISAMDSCHVSIIKCIIDSTMFEEFHCENDSCIGLSIQNLYKILKCMDNNDSLTLQSTETHLVISTQAFSTELHSKSRHSEFELNLFDLDTEDLEIPDDIQYDVNIKMFSHELAKTITTLATVGDICNINCNSEGVLLKANGDIGNANIKLEPNEQCLISVSNDINESYTLKYLLMFTKASMLDSEVIINIAEGMPLQMRYSLDDDNKSFIDYFLAPKIED